MRNVGVHQFLYEVSAHFEDNSFIRESFYLVKLIFLFEAAVICAYSISVLHVSVLMLSKKCSLLILSLF